MSLPRLWWAVLPPPKPRRHRYPGRRPIDDRAALAGIVFVLKTGITWNQTAHVAGRLVRGDLLAAAAGLDRGPHLAGLHEQLLAQLRALGELDLDRCTVDGSHVRALKGGTASAHRRSTAGVRAPSTT